MFLSDMGKIAEKCLLEIPVHFPFVLLDEFVVMPNHVHGIIIINNKKHENPVPCRDVACNVSTNSNVSTFISDETIKNMSSISPKYGSLSTIMRSYKSAVTKWCNENDHKFCWQPRFHDHIIRNENEFYKIKKYIFNNPSNWLTDENNN
jgi:REP element-mobilizing transposase RayT